MNIADGGRQDHSRRNEDTVGDKKCRAQQRPDRASTVGYGYHDRRGLVLGVVLGGRHEYILKACTFTDEIQGAQRL
jgi:hypothetical protein